MNIRIKLLISFLTVATFSIVIGYMDKKTTDRVKMSFLEVSEQSTPVIKALGEIKFNAYRFISSVNEYLFIISERNIAENKGINFIEEQIEEEIEDIEEADIQLQKVLNLYASLVYQFFPEEEIFLNRIKSSVEKIEKIGKQLVQEKQKGLSGNTILKMKMEFEIAEKIFLNDMSDVIKYEDKELEERTTNVDLALAQGRSTVVSISAYCFIIALLIGFFIYRSILKPIIRFQNAVAKMRKGALDTRVEVSSNDEIGKLAVSFNKMSKKLATTTNELTMAKEYVDNTLHSMVGTLIVIAPDTTIKTVNQATLELLEYEKGEIEGKTINLILEEEHQKSFQKTEMKRLIDEGFIKGIDSIYVTKSGRKIPILLSCSVMKNSQGNIEGIVCVAQDISELKNTENALKVAKKEADSANRSKSQFLANMSHEIRTPLNSIVGFSQILLSQLEPYALPRKFIQYLETIKIAGNNLSELINNILDLSKIEAGKTVISIEPINLRLLVQGIYFINKASAQEKGILFNYDFDPQIPGIIDSDRTKLNQILMNLVTNAIKFTPKNREVRLKTLRDDNMILFQVIDQGIGIPKKRLNAIFDQFEQADGSITRNFGGTGLGLAITKRMAKLLKGSIEVKSTLGQGSVFSVNVPLQESTGLETNEVEINPKEVKFHQNNKVLLVEDNEFNQEVVKIWFQNQGLKIHIAENGQIGVEKALSLKPDLILMDTHMPEMDGLSAIKEIRRHPEGADIPIISLSAEAFTSQQQVAYDLGVSDYITKPIDFQTLLRVTIKYLRQDTDISKLQEIEPHTPLPVSVKDQLMEAFATLSTIPMFDSGALSDQIENMLSLCKDFKTPYIDILTKMEDAVFSANDDKYQQLLSKVLYDNDEPTINSPD